MWQSECYVNILLYIFSLTFSECPVSSNNVTIAECWDGGGLGGLRAAVGGFPHLLPVLSTSCQLRPGRQPLGRSPQRLSHLLDPFSYSGTISLMSKLQRWLRTSTAFFLLEISSSSAIGTGIHQISFSSKTEMKEGWLANVLKGKKIFPFFKFLLYNLVISSVSWHTTKA